MVGEAVYPESLPRRQPDPFTPGNPEKYLPSPIPLPDGGDFAGNPTGVYLVDIADNGDQATFTV